MAFEDSMKKLEEYSNKIRDEETSLDDAIKYYDSGIKEYKKLKDILDKANQKITVIESGEIDG